MSAVLDSAELDVSVSTQNILSSSVADFRTVDILNLLILGEPEYKDICFFWVYLIL